MPTQVKLRGAITATQSARTLAAREIDIDTTKKRINLHDGSTVGGIPHANAADIQNGTFVYAVASGTNALTATFGPTPTLSSGAELRIKTAAANTGAVTLNPNGWGAVNVKKLSGGAKAALAAGDLIANMVYKLTYDGTDFIVSTLDHNPGLTSVSQGSINTSTGSFSLALSSSANATATVVMAGGSYGFYPVVDFPSMGGSGRAIFGVSAATSGGGTSASQVARIVGLTTVGGSGTPTLNGVQRYVTSSPPFDLGDGEAGGFVFALMNEAGAVDSYYAADVPPWAYNGPTDIRCDYQCPRTKKKYRQVAKPRSFTDILSGVPVETEMEEITQAIKNADMNLIPHPFLGADPSLTPVLLDPMDPRVRNLIDHQNSGGADDVRKIITGGYLRVDNMPLRRKGPKGLMICGFSH